MDGHPDAAWRVVAEVVLRFGGRQVGGRLAGEPRGSVGRIPVVVADAPAQGWLMPDRLEHMRR
jgi:hypothetical protein